MHKSKGNTHKINIMAFTSLGLGPHLLAFVCFSSFPSVFLLRMLARLNRPHRHIKLCYPIVTDMTLIVEQVKPVQRRVTSDGSFCETDRVQCCII